MNTENPINGFLYADNMYTKAIARSDPKNTLMLEPNLTKLPDGGIMACWTNGGDFEPDDANITSYSRSYDHGRTWEPIKTLFSHSTKGLYTPELSSVADKVYAFPSVYSGKRDFSRDFISYISTSGDSGKTFTSPRTISGCVGNLRVKDTLELDDRILFACSWLETVGDYWAPANGDKDCIVAGKVYCHTAEEHWQDSIKNICGVLIADKAGTIRGVRGNIQSERISGFCEPTLTQLSDGTLVCLMRNGLIHELFESRSYDKGENWTEAVPAGIPSAISKAIIRRHSNGTHYLLLNSDKRGYRNPLSLWISHDDMKTWDTKVDLITARTELKQLMYPAPYLNVGWMCCYPDGFIDEERGILCFVWDDRHNIYYSEYALPNE